MRNIPKALWEFTTYTEAGSEFYFFQIRGVQLMNLGDLLHVWYTVAQLSGYKHAYKSLISCKAVVPFIKLQHIDCISTCTLL